MPWYNESQQERLKQLFMAAASIAGYMTERKRNVLAMPWIW